MSDIQEIAGLKFKDAYAREKISEMQNNTSIMVGDSYGVGYTPEGTVTSWCDLLANKMGLTTNQYYKCVSSGAGFVATGTGGKTFLQVLTENIGNITNKESVKNIFVGGGYNDANYDSTYEDMIEAIQSFCEYCNSNFPNAKIYIACFGYNVNNNLNGASVRNKLACIVLPAYTNTLDTTNPPIFIKNSNLILHAKSVFSSDGFHPNLSGQRTIANKIYQALNGEIARNKPIENIFINFSEPGSGGGRVALNAFWTDENIFVYSNDDVNCGLNGITLTGNQEYDIGTYETESIFPTKDTTFNIPVQILTVSYESGSTVHHVIDCKLIFKTNGHVYLKPRILEDNNWKSIQNITTIMIYAFGHYISPTFN